MKGVTKPRSIDNTHKQYSKTIAAFFVGGSLCFLGSAYLIGGLGFVKLVLGVILFIVGYSCWSCMEKEQKNKELEDKAAKRYASYFKGDL